MRRMIQIKAKRQFTEIIVIAESDPWPSAFALASEGAEGFTASR